MINTKEIRKRLPHGSIARIAEELEIEPRVVSEVLNRGWHPDVKNAVLDSAVKILEEEHNGQLNILERTEEIDLDNDNFSVPPRYQKKKKNLESGGIGGQIIILSLIGLLVAWFFLPGFKDTIKNFFAKYKTEPLNK